MPHLVTTSPASSHSLSEDGRVSTVVLSYNPTGSKANPAIIELPYRSSCGVSIGQGSEYLTGVAAGLDYSTLSTLVSLGHDPAQEVAGVVAKIALTSDHSEGYHYKVWGIRGENRNGKFTTTGTIWTFDSVVGITGAPSDLVDAVIVMCTAAFTFDIAWGVGLE